MSADNYYAVIETDNDFVVIHGFMSMLENCYGAYVLASSRRAKHYPDRASALIAAHDKVLNDYIVEYGVIELTAKGEPKRCGMCYQCRGDDDDPSIYENRGIMTSFEIEVIESVQRFYTYEAATASDALAKFNNGDEPATPAYDAAILDYDIRAINGKTLDELDL